MIGAKRDGATWFLAPESNCSDVVGHVPQGLHVVKVGTLDEAYDALVAIRDGKGGSLPQCTVKQMSVRRKEIGVIQAEIAVSSRKVGDSGVRNVYVRAVLVY